MTFCVNALRSDELGYELQIRDKDPEGKSVDEKRMILRTLLARERADSSVILEYKGIDLDPKEELELLKNKLNDLRILVDDYIDSPSSNIFCRLSTRLNHVYRRIIKISPGDELSQFHSQLLSLCLELLGSIEHLNEEQVLVNSYSVPSENVHHEQVESLSFRVDPSITSQKPVTNTTGLSNVVHDTSTAEPKAISINDLEILLQQLKANQSSRPNYNNHGFMKSVPVFKWNIKFTGNVQDISVLAFLQRCEELRVARNITHEQLFNSAIDLFSNAGLLWFRSIRSRVNNWQELETRLKLDFLPSDFDEELLDQIKTRKQGQEEKPTIYISIMINMFQRLINVPSESEQLKYIIKNLQPYYATQLSLIEIISIDQLTKLCKKLEETRMRNANYRKPNSIISLIEPDLVYRPSGPGKASVHGVQTSNSDSTKTSYNFKSKPKTFNRAKETTKCFNCNELGHSYHTCDKERKIFCYICGHPEAYFPTCPKCSKNAVRGPVSSAAQPQKN